MAFWGALFQVMVIAGDDMAACIGDHMCGREWTFCLKALGPMMKGRCVSCWMCCLFGNELLGMAVCPDACACHREGQSCFGDFGCAQGQMCIEDAGTAIGTCQNPNAARGDAYERAALYYRMLEEYDNVTVRPDSLFSVEGVAAHTKGRPCNGTKRAESYVCGGGMRCIPAPLSDMSESERLKRPMGVLLGGVCEPCREGEYCPAGTVGRDGGGPCPKGFYCPDPSVAIRCDEGSFCSEGMVEAQTCDYERLLMQNMYVEREKDTVLDRLTRYGDPMRGNYCPANSTAPSAACSGGFYCPNASIAIRCPEGSFCKSGSIRPRECPVMTECPDGASEPVMFGVPLIFAGMVLLAIACVKAVRWWMMREQKVVRAVVAASFSDVFVMGDDGEDAYLEQVLKSGGEEGEHGQDIGGMDMSMSNMSNMSNMSSMSRFVQAMAPFKKYVRRAEYIGVKGISARSGPLKEPWLWNNSVQFPCGKMSAIMGASGCGKSVSLDLMRGRVPRGAWVTGSVHVRMADGEKADLEIGDLEKGGGGFEISKLQSFCGFVPQDDIVHGDLTVWENLMFSVLIKLPGLDKAERMGLVGAVIEALGLSRIKDDLVGSVDRRGISGGQRKRVNVGVEMVGLPSILVMDEPTSGLDATMTWDFLRVCKDLSSSGLGMTVLCVIHQPRYSAYMLFDHVLLLTKYGTVFCGSPAMSIAYFKHGLNEKLDVNENPADALIDLIGRRQQDMNTAWKRAGWKWVRECGRTYPYLDTAMDMNVQWGEDARRTLGLAIDRVCGEHTTVLGSDELRRVFECMGVPVRDAGDMIDIRRDAFIGLVQRACENAWLEKKYDNIVERIDLLEAVAAKHLFLTKEDEEMQVRAATLAMRFGRRLMRRAGIRPFANREHHPRQQLGECALLLLCMNAKAVARRQQVVGGSGGSGDSGGSEEGAVEFFALSAMRLWGQVPTVMMRKLVSLWRSPWPIQVLIPVVAAFIIGKIHGAGWGLKGYPSNVVMAMACIGVLSAVTHVRTYAMDRAVVRRETDGPLSITAYVLSYALVDFIWLFAMPMLFVVPYYYLTLPQTGFWVMYAVGLMVCWWNSGMAYVVSALPLGLQWANLIAVFVSVIFGAFIHGMSPSVSEARGGVMEWVLALSYNRWAMEILTLYEMSYHQDTVPNHVWLLMTKLGVCGEEGIDLGPADSAKGVLTLWKRMKQLREKSLVAEEGGCAKYVGDAFGALLGWGLFFRLLCYTIVVLDSNTIIHRTLWRMGVTVKRRLSGRAC